MNLSNQVIFMADDDADDRYFMHKALQQVQPSVTFVETEDGGDLLARLESWNQQPTPRPVHLILPRRRTVRFEYAQGQRIGNADGD